MIIPTYQLLFGLFLAAFVGGIAGWNCRVQSLPPYIRRQIITWRADRKRLKRHKQQVYQYDDPQEVVEKDEHNVALEKDVRRWY